MNIENTTINSAEEKIQIATETPDTAWKDEWFDLDDIILEFAEQKCPPERIVECDSNSDILS